MSHNYDRVLECSGLVFEIHSTDEDNEAFLFVNVFVIMVIHLY